MALYHIYSFIFSLKMAFKNLSMLLYIIKMVVNKSCVRLYLLLLYLFRLLSLPFHLTL